MRQSWVRAVVLPVAVASACGLWGRPGYGATSAPTAAAPEKIIIDTDIGTDIDDAFAVALSLQSPELKLLGLTTASGDTAARARILDRMLGELGYADIPVAVGRSTTLPLGTPPVGRQSRYGDQSHFAKSAHADAVEFILEQIHRFPGQITLVAIGPLTNLGDLIDRDPEAFRKLKRVVIMGGAIGPVDMGGWGSTATPTPEYNIVGDITAAQKVFASGVPLFAMPLDSTAQLKLDEVKRDAVFAHGSPVTDSLGILYLLWGNTTPVLYDVMAVAYVLDPSLCPVQPMHVTVDEQGVTRAGPGGPTAQVCMHSDPEQFFHFYLSRTH